VIKKRVLRNIFGYEREEGREEWRKTAYRRASRFELLTQCYSGGLIK
jgi:hypothetical protein